MKVRVLEEPMQHSTVSRVDYAQSFCVVSLTHGLAWRDRITAGSHEDDDRPRTH